MLYDQRTWNLVMRVEKPQGADVSVREKGESRIECCADTPPIEI